MTTRTLSTKNSQAGFGMLLGICIAALDSCLAMGWLWEMGRPDFLIRPGSEGVHAIIVIILGVIAGICYGLVLDLYTWLRGHDIRRHVVLFSSLAVAAGIYGVGYPLVIRFEQIFPWLPVMHIIVFCSCIAIAVLTSRKRPSQP